MKKHFALFCLLGALCGCAGSDNEIVADKSLAEIYATAYAEFNDENYDVAATDRRTEGGAAPGGGVDHAD